MSILSCPKTLRERVLTPLALLALALGLGGCASMATEHLPRADRLPLVDEAGAAAALPPYRIRPGDELDIKFFYTRELNEQLKVRPDGKISLQLVDEQQAAGLTPKELTDALVQRYAERVNQPVLSVIVRSFAGHQAYVGGEVAVPQTVALDGGLTPMQALVRAGGARATAQLKSVVLVRKGPDGAPQTYRLDLSDDAVSQGRRDLRVALQPSDVVYVPRTPIANANRFVQQYIVDLVLFRGIQLGYNVDVVRSGGGVAAPAN